MQQVIKGGRPEISEPTKKLITKEFADLELKFWEGVTWTLSKRLKKCDITCEFWGQRMSRAFFVEDNGKTEEEQYKVQMSRVVDDIFSRLQADKSFRAQLQNAIEKQYDVSRVGADSEPKLIKS